MVPVLAGWMFASFIYFKVAIDAAFYSSLSIIAALLMSLILGGVIFILTATYALRLAAIDASRSAWQAIVMPMALACCGFALVCRMIVFGFSKRLNDDVEIFTGYRNRFNDDFLLFAILVALPIVAHYCMVLFYQHQRNDENA